MNTYLQYNDPIRIQFRNGTEVDPYDSLTESQKIINNVIILKEIPDEFTHVTITGYTEGYDDIPNSTTEFTVNYTNGMITFDSSQEGKTVNASYMGRGFILYPAERIYAHGTNPNVTVSLQSMIDGGNQALKGLEALSGALTDVSSATTTATTQAAYAKTQGDYAKTQGDYSKTQGDAAKAAGDALVYKGVYAAATAYIPRNLVYYNGSTYMCVLASTGNLPTNTTYFKRLSGMAWRAAYSTSTTYNYGDFVVDASGNTLYMSIIDSNLNKALTDTASWNKMVSVQTAIDNAATAVTNANAATTAANTAKANADTATTAANTATTAANTAKANADTATSAANTATSNANSSAANADTKATYAQTQGDYAKATGDSLIHKGTYSAATAYIPRNMVYYNGATYMNTVASTGVLPTDTSKWTKITNMIWKGIYSASTTYNFGDVVSDSVNQNVYICILDGTLNKALTTVANWTVLMSVTAAITNANTATTAANNATTAANTAATAANTAKANTDIATTNANNASAYATDQGDYAKTQGDYSKAQGAAATTAKTNADTATSNANAARDAANTAASGANAAKASADAAATVANTAASNADAKAALAVTATTNANNATTAANTAKTNADAATTAATTATTNANTATTAANQAKSNADTATAAANKAKSDAETATAAANTATTTANTAASNADAKAALAVTATTNANNATTAAGVATTNANKAKTDAEAATTAANTAATSVNTAITAASTATTAANNAATAANTAKSNADIATSAATKAKTDADTATAAATLATTAANNATTSAITATTAANTAKTNADTSASYANTQGSYALTQGDYAKAKGDAANTATELANTATSNANTATSETNTAKINANSATIDATNAATSANTAATAANTAKLNADTATGLANIATTNANNATTAANTLVSRTTAKGTYSSSTTYYPNNVVSYNGSSYMCISQALNKIPTDTGYWQLLALKGNDGTGSVVGVASANSDIVIAGTVQTPDLAISSSLKTIWNDKYTKAEVDTLINQVTSSNQWKASVANFAAIATTYPNPQDGWTVNVNDTDYTYRYTGSAWVAISANSIPNASSTADGKMSIANFNKLAGISTGANKVEYSSNNGQILIDGAGCVVYTHPTGAGNNHIPTGGSANNFLKYSASGTAVWATPTLTGLADVVVTTPSTSQVMRYNGTSWVNAGLTFSDIGNGTLTGALVPNFNADLLDGMHADYGSGTATIAARDANGNITAKQFSSNIAQGGKPFNIVSTTMNDNLNADMVDGFHLDQDVRTTAMPTFAVLTLAHTVPILHFRETDQGTDEKRWALINDGKMLQFRTLTDTGGNGITAMSINRGTGTAITNVSFNVPIVSNVAAGTAPITVASATLVSNLNADFLDGYHGDTGSTANTVVVRNSTGIINATRFFSTIADGTSPFAVTSTTAVTNLNADMVDGFHLNQALLTTSNPSFAALTITGTQGATTIGGNGSGNIIAMTRNSANYIAATTAGGYLSFIVNGDNHSDATASLLITAARAVKTRNNTLDDGSGSMSVSSQITSPIFKSGNYSIQYNATEDSLDFIYG